MPARRLRNENWLDSLKQIQERGGGIELAIERRKDPLARPAGGVLREPPRDLLWRVRLLDVTADSLIIEAPGTMGKTLTLEKGSRVVGVMAIGQTRWMFHAVVVDPQVGPSAGTPGARPPVRLSMPDHVERCTRRAQQRISTVELTLPDVYAWHLRDPASAVPTELASRDTILALLASGATSTDPLDTPGQPAPDLGPGFRAKLGNIGGGGVGLEVSKEDRASAESTRLYWLRMDLRPVVPAPVGLTARLAHSHIDAMQNMYAGMAFEFALNPGHRDFVTDQIGRYAAFLQRTANAPVVPET